MAWDTTEFQRRASKLEHAKDAPSKKAFTALRNHVHSDRTRHDEARAKSIKESKSIVAIILESADPAVDIGSISEHQHGILQEYYSTLLSIRDREELTKILCKMQPDLLTSTIRDLVAAYDPIIRAVHNAVDLSDTVSDLQSFLDDLIKVRKPKKNTTSNRNNTQNSDSASDLADDPDDTSNADTILPTVDDYVQLVRKHIPSAHKFLHQVGKNAPDLLQQYREYAKACVAEFRVRDSQQTVGKGSNASASSDLKVENTAAGTLTPVLNTLFSSLPSEQQTRISTLLSHHVSHLSHLSSTSSTRLKTLLTIESDSVPKHKKSHAKERGALHGPGIFLARWHALLDEALITPQTLKGPVRSGRDVKAEGRGKVGGDAKAGRVEALLKGADKGSQQKPGKGGDTRLGKETDNERKRSKDEVESEEVWNTMREGWEGVVRGLEVMGD